MIFYISKYKIYDFIYYHFSTNKKDLKIENTDIWYQLIKLDTKKLSNDERENLNRQNMFCCNEKEFNDLLHNQI